MDAPPASIVELVLDERLRQPFEIGIDPFDEAEQAVSSTVFEVGRREGRADTVEHERTLWVGVTLEITAHSRQATPIRLRSTTHRKAHHEDNHVVQRVPLGLRDRLPLKSLSALERDEEVSQGLLLFRETSFYVRRGRGDDTQWPRSRRSSSQSTRLLIRHVVALRPSRPRLPLEGSLLQTAVFHFEQKDRRATARRFAGSGRAFLRRARHRAHRLGCELFRLSAGPVLRTAVSIGHLLGDQFTSD